MAAKRRRLLVWGAMVSLYIYCMVYMQRLLQAAVDGPRPAAPCAEKRNFVFIKCMKCATETMGTVLRRFGYIRNQSFVVPAGSNIYLGWPFLMKERDYRPSRRGFSILTEHAVYNRSIMRKLMPPDTIYISIVREPFAHFVSVFHYFRVGDIANVSGPDPVAEYLTNPDRYERAYKGHGVAGVRHCIPDNFSITKNLLSHCLGMPTGFPRGRPDLTGDSAAVAGYIGELVEAFDLVMLVEYFHESLVLLRRLMCWSLKDILYHRSNEGGYERRSWSPGVRDLHRRWSGADYALYDRFNRTFWAKVRKEGENFFEEEVRHFVDIQRRVSGFCEDGRTGSITIQQSRWNDVFTLSRSECTLMNTYILYLIKSRYDTSH